MFGLFEKVWQVLQTECSGAMAYQTVADLSRYHRIQASPGFRQAAEYVHQRLSTIGLQAEILRYPATTQASFWSAHSFQEWSARSATLHLVEPEGAARKLADYHETPISLIQRSVSFDGEVEVVAVEKGERPADYEGLDVAGKVVLTRGSLHRVHDLAVRRRGAVGLLFDGMTEAEPVRPLWALPDAIQYTSFWWYGTAAQERHCFGFALSPREGERLRRLIRQQKENGDPPIRLRAHIDARLYDGDLEVVQATIPGAGDAEVVLVAHLCHPQPSCNDNASGAAALLEVARSLHALIAAGQLAPPQRTIRFLWVPEMSGTYAYLSANEGRLPHMVAGLNLDMVGQDQARCGSVLLLESPPETTPSFATDLMACLIEGLYAGKRYPLFRHARVPFRGGSDHIIFSDPSVGVPMPMLIQWPDRFYHTTADTLDKVDPAMLRQVVLVAAGYAYGVADAGAAEARWLASEMSARFRQRLIRQLQDARTAAANGDGPSRGEVERQVAHRVQRHQAALATLTRLAAIEVAPWQRADQEWAEAELARVADALPSGAEERSRPEAADIVPRRRFRGPLSIAGLVRHRPAAERDAWWEVEQRLKSVAPKTSWTIPLLAQYWADGQRTVAEIGECVRLETGLEVTSWLVEYFRFLSSVGLVNC